MIKVLCGLFCTTHPCHTNLSKFFGYGNELVQLIPTAILVLEPRPKDNAPHKAGHY